MGTDQNSTDYAPALFKVIGILWLMMQQPRDFLFDREYRRDAVFFLWHNRRRKQPEQAKPKRPKMKREDNPEFYDLINKLYDRDTESDLSDLLKDMAIRKDAENMSLADDEISEEALAIREANRMWEDIMKKDPPSSYKKH